MFENEFSESLVLAVLASKINLNPERLNTILSAYSSLSEGLFSRFNKLVAKENSWLLKLPQNLDLEKEISILQQKLTKNQINLVTVLDNNYPSKLKILEKYPLVLYYQGNLELIESANWITVVGARNITNYGQNLLKSILEPCVQSGLGVISGLALGVDKMAHEIALDSESKTIAAIGSGLDLESFYPSQNWVLKNRIIENNGLVLSEYSPGTTATIYNFPARNRILAVLSELTWVVQANNKSGSLITANYARDLGKVVATTPGSVLDSSLNGNLELVKNGANIISSPEDIFQLLGLKTHPEINPKPKPVFTDNFEEKVYGSLNLEAVNIEKISTETNIEIVQLASILSLLELKGYAQNLGQNEWARN